MAGTPTTAPQPAARRFKEAKPKPGKIKAKSGLKLVDYGDEADEEEDEEPPQSQPPPQQQQSKAPETMISPEKQKAAPPQRPFWAIGGGGGGGFVQSPIAATQTSKLMSAIVLPFSPPLSIPSSLL